MKAANHKEKAELEAEGKVKALTPQKESELPKEEQAKEEQAKEAVEAEEGPEVIPEEAIKETPEEAKPSRRLTRAEAAKAQQQEALANWKPRTSIGKAVKAGEITDIDEILSSGKRILEPELVDTLLPGMESELLLIGQAKGKFGGGQRRIFKQTQKKTAEGNVPSFTTMAVVGNKNGFVGLGMASSKETVPARNKALRTAKLNIIKILRGCGSWECGCGTPHSVPFKVTGKCGSVRVTLIPAPKGTGLCIERECQKLLALAGIKDVWSQTRGNTKTKSNLIMACFNALKQLIAFKIQDKVRSNMNIVGGALPQEDENGKKE